MDQRWMIVNGELRHAKEWDDHKYVAKVPRKGMPNKFRYFYTKEAYQAYLKGRDKDKLETKSDNAGKKLVAVSNKKASIAKNKSANSKTTLDRTHHYSYTIYDTNTGEVLAKKELPSSKKKSSVSVKDVVSSGKNFVGNLAKQVVKDVKSSAKVLAVIHKDPNKKLSDFKKLKDERDKKIISAAGKDTKEKDFVQQKQDKTAKTKADTIAAKKDHELKTERMPELAEQRKMIMNEFDPFPELKPKDKAVTLSDDQAAVNPNYDPYDPLYSYNCAYCTIAYDLRRRGYDVEANQAGYENGRYTTGLTVSEIAALYTDKSNVAEVVRTSYEVIKAQNGGQMVHNEAVMYASFEQEMLSHGEGARGNLCLYWYSGGGHSVSWEVENGKVVIRDSQTNNTYSLSDFQGRAYDMDYIRTDNLHPTKEVLKYVHNRNK